LLPFDRHFVLGVPVDGVTEADVLSVARQAVEAGRPVQIVTVNAEYVVMAQGNEFFLGVLKRAELATPDGAGVVWALRRRGVMLRRLGGSDLIWSLSEQAAQRGHRVFFLGAAEGVAGEVARRLSVRYPGLLVAGTLSGSARAEEEAEIVSAIRSSGADVLFVAYGAPAQDLWIARNVQRLGVSVAIGVGGSFDYVAGKTQRAPVWMRERGLDWLWRLVKQPWRWRRMLALPRFILLVLMEPGTSSGHSNRPSE
jgi:N-acetylglucosaminyldiphosphoundecaprenol N-acetyl-beta-D-mannosaminyltransferase